MDLLQEALGTGDLGTGDLGTGVGPLVLFPFPCSLHVGAWLLGGLWWCGGSGGHTYNTTYTTSSVCLVSSV